MIKKIKIFSLIAFGCLILLGLISCTNKKDDLTQMTKEIDEITENITLEDEEKVNEIINKYNLLTEEEKKNISNYEKLENAVKRIESLKKIQRVIDFINSFELNAIGDRVLEVKNEYDKLTDEEKKEVTNYNELVLKLEHFKKMGEEFYESLNNVDLSSNYDLLTEQISDVRIKKTKIKYEDYKLIIQLVSYDFEKANNDYENYVSCFNILTQLNEYDIETLFLGDEDKIRKLSDDYQKLSEEVKNKTHYISEKINSLLERIEEMKLGITYEYIHTKLYLLDVVNNYIELKDCPTTTINERCQIYKKIGENLEEASFDDLYSGMENIYVKYDKNGGIYKILIDGEPVFPRIRVAIRKSIDNISDNKTLYHDKITIFFEEETTITDFTGKKIVTIPRQTEVPFYDQMYVISFVINKINRTIANKIFLESKGNMKVTSINRALGNPTYSGTLEIMSVAEGLLLINEVLMEDYLRKVVPSEMPSSWEIEALKAQSIAARTYAYREIYNRTYIDKGYVVDDSESSQVYNNQSENERCNAAIKATEGETMFYNGKPIVSYYYSCSSGLTGSGNEVWIKDGVTDEIPYLVGQNLTNVKVDTSSEDSMLSFFKNLNVEAPSNEGVNFRWKITMNKNQLRTAINKTIHNMATNYPESFPIVKEDGTLSYESFPEDIGEIRTIYVKERGKSGVVVSLEVVCTNIRFRIINQYNIRFTIRPNYADGEVIKYYGRGFNSDYEFSTSNVSILPSGYFALEWHNDELTFFGGGTGHGVGMCQYGTQKAAKSGKTYKEILNTYYKNISFEKTNIEYTPLTDFKNYL